jgi:hypothetical protein
MPLADIFIEICHFRFIFFAIFSLPPFQPMSARAPRKDRTLRRRAAPFMTLRCFHLFSFSAISIIYFAARHCLRHEQRKDAHYAGARYLLSCQRRFAPPHHFIIAAADGHYAACRDDSEREALFSTFHFATPFSPLRHFSSTLFILLRDAAPVPPEMMLIDACASCADY